MPYKIPEEKQFLLREENINYLYRTQKMTMNEIAKYIGVSLSTIRRKMNEYNIPIHEKKIHLSPGIKYGKLTTIELICNNEYGTEVWKCLCDCGNYKNVKSTSLINRHTVSCGCKKNDGSSNYKHGLRKSRLYNIYEKMKSRCYNENCSDYKNYGGRGIHICDIWNGEEGFITFYQWSIQNGYMENLSIDRIDVDGDYSPDNCRWTDSKTQSNNRRTSRRIEYHGDAYTVKEWSEIYGVPYERLRQRLDSGWDIERALLTPKMKNQFR